MIAAGVGQVITGVDLNTVIGTVAVATLYVTVSFGVKVTDNVWPVPAASSVPLAGEYTNVPATPTGAVAFNCVALSAVPTVIAAGVGQVITGVVIVTVAVATLGVTKPSVVVAVRV